MQLTDETYSFGDAVAIGGIKMHNLRGLKTWRSSSTSMIAAVSNRGLMRSSSTPRVRLNVAIFIDFMKRLLKDAKQKSLSDCRQFARPSRQGGSGLAGAPQGRDRDLFISRLCAGTQPMNISTTI